MQTSGINSDGSLVLPQVASTTLPTSFTVPDAYGLAAPISKPSLLFDAITGWLAIAGNANNNIVKETITNKGYYQFDIDGSIFSSDRSSKNFYAGIAGATKDSVLGINFDGGLGYDTLLLASQKHSQSFDVMADDAIKIDGQITANSIFLKSQDIVNEGAIAASNITAEFSRSYSDVSGAKITASNGGSILLNGGQTGDLQVQGEFFATGATGGKIDFRGKTVNLIGANLDASGKKSGGTILIGGDYQGIDPTGLGTLSNAQFTFVDQNSRINANAVNTGDGGKVIIWADGDTDFRGSITAQGGSKSGDGGFVEISGKKNLNFAGAVDVDALNGELGNILLDPTDLIIEADDNNYGTFDVSDLEKLRGNVSLSATNNIIFNTEVSLLESRGTISIVAGNEVRFGRVFETGGRNLNVSAAYIVSTNDYWRFYEYINDPYSQSYDNYYSNSPYRDEYLDSYYLNNPYYAEYTEYNDDDGNNFWSTHNWNLPSYISTTSYTTKASGNIRLTSRGRINLHNVDISSSNLQGNAGNIILDAGDSIYTKSIYSTAGGGKGGNVSLSAKNNIENYEIRTYNTYGNGISGNVKLVSTDGKIHNSSILSGYGFYANAGDAGDAGSVVVDAFRDLNVGIIRANSYSGAGNSVKLTSRQGSIYLDSTISTYSFAADGGDIILNAYQNINLKGYHFGIDNLSNDSDLISSYAVNNGKAGVIKFTANQDITIGSEYPLGIYASSRGGDGNNITITSVYGSINVNGLISATSLAGGNAGMITLNSAKDIKVGDIFARSRDGEVTTTGVWNGGRVKLDAGGNIETGNITVTSITGNAGNVTLKAGSSSDTVAKNIKVGIIGANSKANGSFVGNGGKVILTASGNVEAGYITSAALAGNAGNVKISAGNSSGSIKVGDILANYEAGGDVVGNGGNVALEAGGDIEVGAIASNVTNGSGKGGNISLISGDGDIEIGNINAGAIAGNGGNVRVESVGDILLDGISTSSQVNAGDILLISTEGKIDNYSRGSGNSLFAGSDKDAGSVTLKAYGDIITSSINAASSIDGNGGNVTLKSKAGKVDNNGEDIYTSSPKGIAGNVIISAEKDINLGNISAGVNDTGDAIGQGGNVSLKGSGNITAGNITTASQNAGNGGNIAIASLGNVESGNITTASNAGNAGYIKIAAGSLTELDKNIKVGDLVASSAATGDVAKTGGVVLLKASGNIESGKIFTSSVTGNAGNIALNADLGITVGNIDTSANGDGNAGSVTLEADGNIETGNITTTSITGNAGNVTLKANLGKSVAGNLGIKAGNIDAFANGDGNAGDVKLTAGFDSNIDVQAIRTNVDGKGDGGEVYITGGGNIVVDSIRADSIGGKAGNIRLIASKTVRVTGSFTINGENYSLYTDAVDDASGAKGGNVTIEHSSKITDLLSPFIIGDASTNGTFAGVSDGVLGLVTKSGSVHRINGGKYVFDNIKIIGQNQNTLASRGIPIPADYFDDNDVFLGFVFSSNYLSNKRSALLLDSVIGIYRGFTLQELKEIAKDTLFGVEIPSLNIKNANELLKADLNFYLYLYGITTPRTKGHFIAQSFQETGSFSSFGEINSSVSGYNLGGGLLQLTGEGNYKDFGTYIGISGLEKRPELVASNMSLSILSAMWYWSVQYANVGKDLNTVAQNNLPTVNTVDLITSTINNGENLSSPNAQKRREYFLNAVKVLGIN